MQEFIAEVTNGFIVVSSIMLFAYWFRYVCALILATNTAHDCSDDIASSNQLDFREVRSILRERFEINLDILHKSLERDYTIIIYLLENTTGSNGESCIEAAMLRLHYRLMSSWFRLTRTLLPESARHALEEMSLVVVHMAGVMGERGLNASCGAQ